MPADAMHRIIYHSRQLAETRSRSTHLGAILSVSRANNARDAVTGMLLIQDGWYIQALEGPQDALRDTFGRIIFDRRHTDIRVLADAPIADRAFPDASLAAKQRSPAARLTVDPRRLDGDRALDVLLASAKGPCQAMCNCRCRVAGTETSSGDRRCS